MSHAWAGGLTAGFLQHHTWVPRLPVTPAKPGTYEGDREREMGATHLERPRFK